MGTELNRGKRAKEPSDTSEEAAKKLRIRLVELLQARPYLSDE